jgi:acetyltransferase-like isoleucine patch superfamily enzyme
MNANALAKTVKIYKNVLIGDNMAIEDFVIIGVPPQRKKDGELQTTIGRCSIIRSHSVIYAGNVIGDNFQTGNNVNIREENIIGNNVSVGTKSVIECKTTIEDNVRIHSQAFIPEYCVLKEGCWIGPNVTLTNAIYPKSIRSKEFLSKVIIEKYAKIGANATILPGITIGTNALIGAGSVVTTDVPSNVVVAGNPASKLKNINQCFYPDGTQAYKEED